MKTEKHLADYRWPQLLWHSSQGRWDLRLLPLNLTICAHFWAQALRAEAPTCHLLEQWLWKACVGSQTVKCPTGENTWSGLEGISWAQPSTSPSRYQIWEQRHSERSRPAPLHICTKNVTAERWTEWHKKTMKIWEPKMRNTRKA